MDLKINKSYRGYRVTFITDLLGTVPLAKDVFDTHIISVAVQKGIITQEQADEELSTVQDLGEKGHSGFHRKIHETVGSGNLFLYDYVVKGFLKSGTAALMSNKAIAKISAYKKWTDTFVHPYPRMIDLSVDEPDGTLTRPLRAMSKQGERVSLVKSDYVAAGRNMEYIICMLNNDKGLNFEVLDLCHEYGKYVGFGQWRSGGWGRLEWEAFDPTEEQLRKVGVPEPF